MWKNISIVVACMCAFTFGYPANNQVGNYHYEPPSGRRLELPVQYHAAASTQQQTFQLPPQQQQTHLRQRKSQQTSASFTNALTSQGYNTNSVSDDHENDANDSVRLPLPLGVASINIEPLPLTPGFLYSEFPADVTSYDVKPQRI